MERIQLAKFYVNGKGEMFGDGDTVLDPTTEELAMKDAIKESTKTMKSLTLPNRDIIVPKKKRRK
jgi:hypothetical protein